jgi:hypothetical protein
MRTGRRCTILIQFPEAFCEGQQRKGIVAACGDADHMPVVGHIVTVQVRVHGRRLARAHAFELHDHGELKDCRN